jgi:hypothetical protein
VIRSPFLPKRAHAPVPLFVAAVAEKGCIWPGSVGRVCTLNRAMARWERVVSADVINVFHVEERDNVRRMLHVSIRSRHFN